MIFPILQSVKCAKFFFTLILIAAVAVLFSHRKNVCRMALKETLSSKFNNTSVFSFDDEFYNLMGHIDPLLVNTDLGLAEEVCNKGTMDSRQP